MNAELDTWINGLPHAEKDGLLIRVARGEGAQVQAILQQRFRMGRSAGDPVAEKGRRTAGELWKAAGARRDERERVEVERLAQERARKAKVAAAAYEKRLDGLALRREQAWQQVSK